MILCNIALCVILVPVILQMMMDLEDDDEWSVYDEIEDEDNDR